MKNKYDELREIHQKRVNEFPLMFAFNQEQFDNGMKNWGLWHGSAWTFVVWG